MAYAQPPLSPATIMHGPADPPVGHPRNRFPRSALGDEAQECALTSVLHHLEADGFGLWDEFNVGSMTNGFPQADRVAEAEALERLKRGGYFSDQGDGRWVMTQQLVDFISAYLVKEAGQATVAPSSPTAEPARAVRAAVQPRGSYSGQAAAASNGPSWWPH